MMEREGLIILMLIMLMYDGYSDYDDNYDDDALFDIIRSMYIYCSFISFIITFTYNNYIRYNALYWIL